MTATPGPLSGAGIPSEAFKAHAQMKKALKLTGQLIQKDIPLADALHMGPSLRRMFEHMAEVHESSEVTWGIVFILLAEHEAAAAPKEEPTDA